VSAPLALRFFVRRSTPTLCRMIDLRVFAAKRPVFAAVAGVLGVGALWSVLGLVVSASLPNDVGPQAPLFGAIIFAACVGIARLLTHLFRPSAFVPIVLGLALAEWFEWAFFEIFGKLLVTEDELARNIRYFHASLLAQGVYGIIAVSVAVVARRAVAGGASNAA
jgi:hypothetical protein